MTGAVYARTPNLGLGLLTFNFPNWGDDANNNVKIIDAGFSVLGIRITGPWANNTAYAVGEVVVDITSNTLWRCATAHTSPSTGTFAEYRALNPTVWSDATYITIPDAPINGITYGRKDNSWVPISGSSGIFTTPITIQTLSGNASLILNKASGIAGWADVIFGDTAGKHRWGLILGGAAGETGSEAGSDFTLTRYDDAGNTIDSPINCSRAGGIPNFANGITSLTPASLAENSTKVPTTAWVKSQGYATVDNPIFTGNPRSVTPPASDNDTSIATTAFVQSEITSAINAKSVIIDRYYNSGTPTWNKPANLRYLEVWVQGGGGGGGGANAATSNNAVGGGGGGGGGARKLYDAASLGASVSITIGTGGTAGTGAGGGTAGGNGNSTTFGSLTGTGGIGGQATGSSTVNAVAVGGAAGAGGSGDENIQGSPGTNGIKFATMGPACAGVGGAAAFGGGGGQARGSPDVGGIAGDRGGGGGGGYSQNAGGGSAGGAGGTGWCRVREYY